MHYIINILLFCALMVIDSQAFYGLRTNSFRQDAAESSTDRFYLEIGLECPICLDKQSLFHSFACNHTICADCLERMLDIALKNQSIADLFCYKCKRTLDEYELEKMTFINDKVEKVIELRKTILADKTDKNDDAVKPYITAGVVRKCPQCAANIEKNSGCFHMKCTTCACCFCWECMTPVSYYRCGSNFCCSPYQYRPGYGRSINKYKILRTAFAVASIATVFALELSVIVYGGKKLYAYLNPHKQEPNTIEKS